MIQNNNAKAREKRDAASLFVRVEGVSTDWLQLVFAITLSFKSTCCWISEKKRADNRRERYGVRFFVVVLDACCSMLWACSVCVC